MSLSRLIRTRIGFKNGTIKTLKIVEANNTDMICSNGTHIKILDAWRPNLELPKNPDTGEIDYLHRESEEGGFYAVLKNGLFIGILITVTDGRDMWAKDVLGGQVAPGWMGGNVLDYSKQVMATDFAAMAEWGVTRR